MQEALSSRTNIFLAAYGFCGNPADWILGDGVTVSGLTIPTIIGTNVTLSCMPGHGMVQIGPNSSICMESGEWEPDPSEVHCITVGSKCPSLIRLKLIK